MTRTQQAPERKSQEPGRLRQETIEVLAQEEGLRQGGGPAAIDRQHEKGRKTARERLGFLLDAHAPQLEVGLWAGHDVYAQWGGAPAPACSPCWARSRAGG